MDIAKTWTYPYPKLIDDLRSHGHSSLLIFSYGSLMDSHSARHTLSLKSLATRRPAIAYGLRRVFDRDVPYSPQWGPVKDSQDRGMLNVLPSEGDFINGILIDVAIEDLPALRSREEGYDLIPVVAKELNHRNDSTQPVVAYTFHAPQGSPFTNNTIHPRSGYYEMTRDAAKQFGPAFFTTWLQTTYLSDGKTPIHEWEQHLKLNDYP